MKRIIRHLAVAALLAATAAPLRAATFYVTPTGTGDGSTPATPAGLQAALGAAAVNGEEDDLLLAVGTYSAAAGTFTYDVTVPAATGDTGFYAQGGFSADFTSRSEDPALTVLDGGNARRILFIDARKAGAAPDVGFESITFTRGLATDGTTNGHGGAILGLSEVSAGVHGAIELSLYGCVFQGNVAPGGGYAGAVFLVGALFAGGVEFVGNVAGSAGAASVQIPDWNWGDAVHRHDHTIPATFEHCEFRDNTNTTAAGPVVMRAVGNALTMESVKVHNTTGTVAGRTQTLAAYESTVKMNACQFRNNMVDWWASAIDLLGSSAVITNSLFENNWAGVSGSQGSSLFTGWNYEISGHPYGVEALQVTNCTFVDNKGFVVSPSTRAYSILELQYPQTAVFSNCIFKDNDLPAVYPYGSTYTLRYSRIEGTPLSQGFSDGGGNLTADPSFQDSDPDFKLNWDSPLIDKGDSGAVPAGIDYDFKGAIRVFDASGPDRDHPVVDLGWDEYIDWTLNLTAPAAYTTWLNDGSTRTITWYCNNIGGDLNIALWKGPRETAVKVQDIGSPRCDANPAAFVWEPPGDLEGMDYAIVISPALYPMIERVAVPVAIQHLHLTYPNQGKLYQGSTYTIAWESSGLAGATVLIELYSGTTRVRTIAAAAPNTGSYSWKVPFTQAPGSEYRVRVSTTAPLAAEDVSDRAFRILPAITLTAPNGGQSWKRGTTQTIRWTYRNSPGTAVRLELYKNGAYDRTIVASTPIGAAGAGSYAWAIPATLRPAATYTVKVRSATFPKVYDFSNKVFTITK